MGWYSLLPPALVLILALTTRKVILSLLSGLFLAGLIAKNFDPIDGVGHLIGSLAGTLELPQMMSGVFTTKSNWSIFIFIASLGTIITLLEKSGATSAFTFAISKRVKSAKGVESISLLLSMLFFIDDYFSSLSIGRLMRPLTDRFGVARAKLAFLIDSMASPLAVLCPFSSWVGVVIGFLANNGVSEDLSQNPRLLMTPFWLFLMVIPFVFYSFIIMGTSWYIVLRGISFGSMAKFEQKAYKNLPQDPIECTKGKGRLGDFFAIWALLVSSLIGALLYCGDAGLFGGSNTLIEALHHSEITSALFICSVVSLLGSLGYFIFIKAVNLKSVPSLLKEGVMLMKSALIILVIAWSLGAILREDLNIGNFIAKGLLTHFDRQLLPLAIFMTSLLTAFATGSSWGTLALLFPMVLPTLFAEAGKEVFTDLADLPTLLQAVGALLSGAVAGDHISPISDTTVMTSLSTDMPHIDHVTTQMNYAIFPILATALGYAMFYVLPDSMSSTGQLLTALSCSFIFLFLGLEVFSMLNLSKFLETESA